MQSAKDIITQIIDTLIKDRSTLSTRGSEWEEPGKANNCVSPFSLFFLVLWCLIVWSHVRTDEWFIHFRKTNRKGKNVGVGRERKYWSLTLLFSFSCAAGEKKRYSLEPFPLHKSEQWNSIFRLASDWSPSSIPIHHPKFHSHYRTGTTFPQSLSVSLFLLRFHYSPLYSIPPPPFRPDVHLIPVPLFPWCHAKT